MNPPVTAAWPLTHFIRTVLLGDMRRMVYDANLHYLAFGNIAVGIEFLGACDDPHPFHAPGHSAARFNLGIARLGQIDARYVQYNQPASPYRLYNFLRCGTAHVLRPHGPIVFTERRHNPPPGAHLSDPSGVLVLVSEDFYDHFAQACEALIAELPTRTEQKLLDPYLFVGPVVM